jgi:hypothetical protein
MAVCQSCPEYQRNDLNGVGHCTLRGLDRVPFDSCEHHPKSKEVTRERHPEPLRANRKAPRAS